MALISSSGSTSAANRALLPATRHQTPGTLPEWPSVEADQPALRVATDFRLNPPVTVGADVHIYDAHRHMKRAGVRSLLVTRDDAVIGLVTSYHIQGDRLMQFLHSSGYTWRSEIAVRHLMTPWEDIQTLELNMVREARVGDIVEYLGSTRATHVLIVEHSGEVEVVRGLISRSRVEQQLGAPIRALGWRSPTHALSMAGEAAH